MAGSRSAPNILKLVDTVFANAVAQEGVALGHAVEHIAVRDDIPGLVELWPTIKPSETAEPLAWDAPRDRPPDKYPAAVLLAGHIADRIDLWIRGNEAVSTPKPRRCARCTPAIS